MPYTHPAWTVVVCVLRVQWAVTSSRSGYVYGRFIPLHRARHCTPLALQFVVVHISYVRPSDGR
jgi:hypothetical protein